MEMEEKLPGETAKAYALRIIRDNIVNLEFKPGSIVSENELASSLKLSRTPVREAIQELQKGQLIEVLPQRGSVIAKIDFDIIDETVFLRRVLETAIVAELCDTITEEQLHELDENIRLQEYYLDHVSPEKIMELDNQFHYDLFAMCHKERIYHLMDSMMGPFNRIRTLSLYSIKDIKIVGDHKALVNAIRMKEKNLASEFIVKHLSRYKLDKEAVMKKYPDYF